VYSHTCRRPGKRIDALLNKIIRHKFASEQHKQTTDTTNKSPSILALSLGDTDIFAPQLVDVACDQLKTFLFAGYDATSTILACVFYNLSLHPAALAAVRIELGNLLSTGANPEAVREGLLSLDGTALVQKVTYISGVVKEALRLPPAATARITEDEAGFTVRTAQGQQYCLDSMIAFNRKSIIQRDPSIYGDTANRSVPER